MSQFPNTPIFPQNFGILHTYSTLLNNGPVRVGTNQNAVVWPTANMAVFVPVRVTVPITFTTLFLHSGSVASGNVDIGVYSKDGTLLVSKGGVASTNGTPQTFTVASTNLALGTYYLAVVYDNTTASIEGTTMSNVNQLAFMGMAQMASAYPLPSTATFANIQTNIFPTIGINGRSFF